MKLSADQIIVDGTTAYMVAEGESPPGATTCNNGPSCWCRETPAWMTAKCHHLETQRTFPPASRIRSCADCIDGKSIHTVKVECPICEGYGLVADGPTSDSFCCSGSISYRLVVREVLPIWDLRRHSVEPMTPHVVMDSGALFMHYRGLDLPRPSAAKPGDYLAICDLVSTEK